MPERLYRTTEVAKILNISWSTVKRWVKEGKIKAIRVGHRWRIPESEILRLLGEKKGEETRCVIYARVSSHKQKRDGNLDRQVERLRQYASAKGYKIIDIITDVASGLKEDRKGLHKLFDLVVRRKVDVVLVEFKDRLTRFGFEYLQRFFTSHGVRIEVVEEGEPKSYMEELIEDFIAIMTSFASRIYGRRSQKFRKLKKCVKEVVR